MRHSTMAFLLVFLLSSLAGCVAQQRLDDETFYAKNGTWQYNVAMDKCYQATIKGLTSIGFQLEKDDPATGSIITNRHPVHILTTATSTGGSTAMATKTVYSIKHYIKVAGGGSSCTVSLVRMRAYINDTETDSESVGWVSHRALDVKNAVDTAVKDLSF